MRIPKEILLYKNIFSVFTSDPDNSYCPIDLPNTCRNTTEIKDSCCFEYPGGVFLQSQFWNYKTSKIGMNESEIVKELGPLDSFTIHGLWPDNCDGSYEQFCRRELFIDDVYYILHTGNFPNTEELYDDLDLLWKSNVVGGDESLWIHEFNKHGSCIKNLYSQCYERWNENEEKEEKLWKERGVIDYFNVTVNLFKKLDTYSALKEHNILPSIDKTYTRTEIEDALKESFGGKEVLINCDRNNVINEIWYYHLLQGSILNEDFQPLSVNDLGKKKPFSRCHDTGIKYYPKGHFPKGQIPGGDRRGQRGVLRIIDEKTEKSVGFIIKDGHWMSKGSPANYQLIKSPFGNYNLKSRLGYCQVTKNDELACHYKDVQQASQFEYDSKMGFIGYSNSYKWGSSDIPKNTKKGTISIISNNEDDFKYKWNMKFIGI
ncbi:similar to Saccharomyces cerevisiae YPL123C RNY1 Vacuolar RNase of the T(2) family, relocalizes to the cytosol where it cleaves tRNAs upon oxidative or stationary phase stress [Maudiozyma barnettii]|nr:similar to Saccharomyces cerevisiae YPL123C RNY1 Vacuolar RNase of the T(2) family, relocalizes to the cytosol where it cleaves tRNAs upon oxidative or stationary phase stress [Kazachstania barnettii]